MGTRLLAAAAIPVATDVAENADWIRWAIDEAAGRGADLLVTPEAALSGYELDWDRPATEGAREQVLAAVREARLHLALGTLWAADGVAANELQLFDQTGRQIRSYRKQLLCGSGPHAIADPDEATHLVAGEGTVTTDVAGLRVGALICNDLWANPLYTQGDDPRLLLRLGAAGAGVVLHAVNTGIDPAATDRDLHRAFHESNLRLRARAAGCYVVTTDCTDPDGRTPSSAPLGVVAPDGSWLVKSERIDPHVFLARVPVGEG